METIAAIATAQSPSAIGIVRLSGEETRRVLAALFTPASGMAVEALPYRRMTYGDIRSADGTLLDRGMAVCFSAAHSYTGEESAELHCHGSPVVLSEVLQAAFAAGARQARPGEFTQRAFLNGKLDLTEAEAVIDLIDAETAEAALGALKAEGIDAYVCGEIVTGEVYQVWKKEVLILDDEENELILPKADCIPDAVSAGLDTVGIRLPANADARRLIRAAGCPIAAPSANRSGRPSPTTALHVLEDMDGRIPLILDGGACQVGVESSVIDATGEVPVILRPGGITPEMVERVLGHVRVDEHVMSPLREGDVARSPGMKYKHYAPKAKTVIFSGAPEHVVSAICRRYDEQTAKGERVAILGLDEHRYGDRTFISLGSEKRPQEAAARLFAALRELDERVDTVALCEAVDTAGIGLAVMNRMGRAAAFDIEQV